MSDTASAIGAMRRSLEEHDRLLIARVDQMVSSAVRDAEDRTRKNVARQVYDRFQVALKALPEGQSNKVIVKFCDTVLQQILNMYGARR